MNTTKLAAPLACVISALTLSAPASHADDGLRIEPVMSVRHSDDSAESMYQLGRHHQQANRLEEAAAAYRTALDKDASHIEARNALATIYFAQKDMVAAMAEFKTILQQQPELSHVRSNLGYAYLLEGNYSAAMPELVEAIVADPTNARAFGNLTLVYERLGAMVKDGGARTAAAASSSLSSAEAFEASEVSDASETLASATVNEAATKTAEASPALPAAREPAAPIDAAIAEKLEYAMAAPSTKGGVAIEIANGTRDRAMADRIANGLRMSGVNVARMTALAPYSQQRTVILYRDGYRKEALELSGKFAVPPAVVNNTRTRNADDRSAVRLVLGKRSAQADIRTSATQLAQLASAR